jgi:glycosyltransferase involved in cell wall biosynthesis
VNSGGEILVDEIAPPGRIAFVGGFEPRRCGIATFTHDLCEAVAEAAPQSQCFAGALNDRPEGYKYPPRVRFEILESDLDSYRRAADFLNFNNTEVLCVQHEFGIYGGPAGSHVLALLKEVRMPVVTTLHTVLQQPDPAQRQVMEELVRRSERLVVMARKGAEILQESYGVPAAKVDVIPHGIPEIPFADPDFYKARFGVEGCRVLLTFGLLGPGKGIEHAIGALPEIVRRHPDTVYLVLGATHPHLVAREGESYRLSLERLAENLGVREHVVFYNRFVSDDELAEFIGAADIYLTPYLNEAQITSGTLAYVFGAGNAVPRTTVGGWKLGRRSYDLPPLRLDHIMRMSDGTGIFQHATFTVPNFHEGYCTDDNARAFILCNLLEEPGRLDHLATSYLAFLAAALNHETGRFRNFMSHGRQWLEGAGSEDSHGRALWALGVGAGRSRNEGHRRLCVQLFDRGLPAVESFNSPRAWAFTLLGVHELLGSNADDAKAGAACEMLTGQLVKLWQNFATEDWPWFETRATYDNARLSQALILSGKATEGEALEIGLKSLRWLVSMQKTQAGHFRPIGSNGFHEKDGARADFDQQPVESHAMVAACLEAFRVTRDPFWSVEAKRAFEWFLGRNDLGLPLYDYTTGGCGDGLHHDRVNANQGAESSLAFHLSLAEMKHAEPIPSPPTSFAI